MINLLKFWTLSNADDFTLDDVPIALRNSIEYTFGNAVRMGDLRYKDGASYIQGFSQPLVFTQAVQNGEANQAYCLTVYDGTTTKLGVIVMTNDTEYTRYHDMMERPGMRHAVARAFGYDDAIIITGFPLASDWTIRAYIADQSGYRAAQAVPMYSTLYVTDVNWRTVADKPAASTFIGTAMPGLDLTGRSPIAYTFDQGKILYVIPLEHYHTDLENVATLNTVCDALLESRVAVLKSDVTTLGASVDDEEVRAKQVEEAIVVAVEALPVFGTSLKSAVETANNMRSALQYIPRP